jgi:hypothetical protein
MLTDPAPHNSDLAGFRESDRMTTLDLPENDGLAAIARSIETAIRVGQTANVSRACADFVRTASHFYEVKDCRVRVLAARPLKMREQWTMELFGDYAPETMVIRVWMRTAVRKEITSFGTFLSTLCHEFCHHLDFKKFNFADSWHTRGFYERAAVLYHHARGTPRKRLVWAPMSRGRWRIDWQRTRRSIEGVS